MKPKFGLLIVQLMLLMTLLPLTTQAQQPENTDFRCQVGDQTVFPRYDEQTQRLVLVSWNTGDDVQVLETGFSTSYFDIRTWSPDCRFLLIGLGQGAEETLVAWNVLENRRVGMLAESRTYVSEPSWSPDSNYALVQTYSGAYLWNLADSVIHFLDTGSDIKGHNFFNVNGYEIANFNDFNLTWDMARHQLLGVAMNNNTGVTAYDLVSGQVVGFYHVGDRTGDVNYALSQDRSEILVMSGAYPENQMGMAVWNRTTGAALQLDVRTGVRGRVRPEAYTEFTYSPDGRYLAISNRDVLVWDLQNLGSAPHAALYKFGVQDQYYPSVRFNDESILEGVGIRYSYHGNSFRAYRWNLQTGEALFDRWDSVGACHNEAYRAEYPYPDLIDWACTE